MPPHAGTALRPETPADDAASTEGGGGGGGGGIKEQVSSPKKKRARDQLDETGTHELVEDGKGEDELEGSVSSTESGRDRATRLEPEKKRPKEGEAEEVGAPPPFSSTILEDESGEFSERD